MGHAALTSLRIDRALGAFNAPGRAMSAEGRLFKLAFDGFAEPAVITSAPVGDDDLPTIVYSNAAFAELSQFAEATDGNTMCDNAAGCRAYLGPIWNSLKTSHRTDVSFSAEIALRDHNSVEKRLLHRSDPIRDERGKITHRTAVFFDVTQRTNLEEAVRRNERLACVGLLAAGIAHEINNPTGAALLAAETALAALDSPNAREHIETCLKNVITSMERCGRIVRTLLRYTRQQPTERQACSINDVVEQSVELTRPYGESHGAELRTQLDASVPLVPMNPLEIELVLVNVLRNAIEAGNGRVTIDVRTQCNGEGVRVKVHDNGCGMNDEQLAHVFDPLYTTRRQCGGSGLGMGIALGLVQGHKGRLEVRSRPGEGTTVTIDLPNRPIENSNTNTQGANHGCNDNSDADGLYR